MSRGALFTARLIAAAKWRTVRTPAARVWLWAGLVTAACGLALAGQAADLVRTLAEVDGNDTVAGLVATTYIRQWALTGFGTLTTTILGFALGAAVLAPLMSSSAPTLMPAHELAGVRTSAMTPYVGALAVHATSLVTLVQLLAMTALAGMLTLDGTGRARALLVSWLVWAVLLVGAQASLWGSRVLRRTAPRAATMALLGLLAVAVAAGALDPHRAAGLFGLSAGYTWFLLAAPPWLPPAVAALAGTGLWWAGWAWCANTVRHGATASPATAVDRRTRPMPPGPVGALVAVVLRSFWRTRSIRDPLAVILALCTVGVLAAGDHPGVIWSVGVGLPVAVGLSFTDNVAAMTGPGNSWLASLPRQGARLLGVCAAWAWLVSVALVAACWAPAVLVGRVSWASTGSVLITAVAAASTVTVAALWHALARPAPAATHLGDGMLTASAAAAASIRLLAVPGLAAWVSTSGSSVVRAESGAAPLSHQLAGAGLCVLGAAAVGVVLAVRWADPRTRARVLAGAA